MPPTSPPWSVGANDLVVGIATSGRTPYVLGAVREARRRGAATVGLACNRPSLLGAEVDLEIAPLVGAEVISGSTRLKAGTATKMILNMISTGAMVQIGKTLGNRMVDLRPTNEKLRIRSRRILREIAGVDDDLARDILVALRGTLETCAGRRPDRRRARRGRVTPPDARRTGWSVISLVNGHATACGIISTSTVIRTSILTNDQ